MEGFGWKLVHFLLFPLGKKKNLKGNEDNCSKEDQVLPNCFLVFLEGTGKVTHKICIASATFNDFVVGYYPDKRVAAAYGI